ncbi:MAG: hypothetical protein WA374_04415 [Acidobacteriaceae bacterium]
MVIDGIPTRSASGTFYLEYRENGRRVQRPVGNSPREAEDAWMRQASPERMADEEAEPAEENPELLTIREAFDRFLREATAMREPATAGAYEADLAWIAPQLSRRLVAEVTRGDILDVMAQGRKENLHPKTITRRLIVALVALRNAGAMIELKRGDCAIHAIKDNPRRSRLRVRSCHRRRGTLSTQARRPAL